MNSLASVCFLFSGSKTVYKKSVTSPSCLSLARSSNATCCLGPRTSCISSNKLEKKKKDYSGFYATCFVEVSDLIVHIFQYPQSIQSQYINTRIDDCVRSGSYRHALRQRWFHLWILQAFQTLKPHGGKKANVMLHFYGVRQLEGCSTREMFRGSKLPWFKIRQFNLTVTSTFI